MRHETSVRIYYADTDAGGVAHHATFVRWLELGRTEWTHAHGNSLATWDEESVVFVVAGMEIKYLAPAYLDETLTIISTLASMRSASLSFAQEIWCGKKKICYATINLVCVDINNKKPVRIPEKLRFGV